MNPTVLPRLTRGVTLILASILASACAVQDRVVLLPDGQGRVGVVEVSRIDAPEDRVRLDRAYATVENQHLRGLHPQATSAQSVLRDYPDLEPVLPARPREFTVQFSGAGTDLTPESLIELQGMRAWLATLPAPEIIVTGHTDAVGTVEDNDRLSLQRAERVRGILIEAGVDARLITTLGRGKRALAFPTADGVAEPRNRRVEIKLR
ncbi:MAG: hypothetical protein RL223_168 [Pseudomonadota bacterium]|jgi:outer membrane protein OmpA-like peptidoglycan-associated protein